MAGLVPAKAPANRGLLRESASGCSQPMPGPDGANLLIRGEFAPRNLSVRLNQIGFFLRRQLNGWLIYACELKHDSSQLVLLCIG